MLAADANFQTSAGLASSLDGDLDEFTYTFAVEHGEWVLLEHAALQIDRKEFAHVITREPEGRLSKIVGAEGEELRLTANLVGDETSARQLNHGAYEIFNARAFALKYFAGHAPNDRFLVGIFLDQANQRNHDLWNYGDAGFLRMYCGFKNSARLHLRNYRVCDAQAAASVTEHGVEFMQALDALQNGFGFFDFLGISVGMFQLKNPVVKLRPAGQELMQRRIQQTDGNRQSVHGFEQAMEIFALHRQQFVECFATARLVVGHDHFAHVVEAVFGKEHVLSAAETHAFRSECAPLNCIARDVPIRSDAHAAARFPQGHE